MKIAIIYFSYFILERKQLSNLIEINSFSQLNLGTRLTSSVCQVETIKIFNQATVFIDWWVGGGLEFSQSAIGELVNNIFLHPLNSTHEHS